VTARCTNTFEIEGFPRARLAFLVEGEATAHAVRLTLAVDDPDTMPIAAELQRHAGYSIRPDRLTMFQRVIHRAASLRVGPIRLASSLPR
jgi:hypothetical protein